jgi:hypothetical protein
MGVILMQEDNAMCMQRYFAVLLAMLLGLPTLAAAETTSIEVWKSANCDCCIKWVEHLEANGLATKVNDVTPPLLDEIKRKAGISEEYASCHTAKIGGYVIEGHVPAPDIKRLVAEKPDAVGLTVPGMPIGSPGMEQGNETEPYDVLLLKKDGAPEIFTRH